MNIKIKHTLTWLFIVISAHLSVAVLYSQEDQPKPSLQDAMDDFS